MFSRAISAIVTQILFNQFFSGEFEKSLEWIKIIALYFHSHDIDHELEI